MEQLSPNSQYFDFVPDETLLKILEGARGAQQAAVCKRLNRVSQDNALWKERAEALGVRSPETGTPLKRRVRRECDWDQHDLLANCTQLELPLADFFALSSERIVSVKGEGEVHALEHGTGEWKKLDLRRDLFVLVDSKHYMTVTNRSLRIRDIETGKCVKRLARPSHWVQEEGGPSTIDFGRGCLFEARGRRARVWFWDNKDDFDISLWGDFEAEAGRTICDVKTQCEAVALIDESGGCTLEVDQERFQLPAGPYWYMFIVGNLCRFSGAGIQVYNPWEGCKKIQDESRPYQATVPVVGMEAVALQDDDGTIATFGGEDLKLEDQGLTLEDEVLTAAARPRPGILLLGFHSGRVLAIRWEDKEILDDVDLGIGAIEEFQVSDGYRVLANGESGGKSLHFASPHDRVQSTTGARKRLRFTR